MALITPITYAEIASARYATISKATTHCQASNPTGLQYTQFCDRYLQWRGRQDPVMRQVHKAGEKQFIDYAGQTVPVIDRSTGEVHSAEVFVAVLGASSYTYCEATWSQALPDWSGQQREIQGTGASV